MFRRSKEDGGTGRSIDGVSRAQAGEASVLPAAYLPWQDDNDEVVEAAGERLQVQIVEYFQGKPAEDEEPVIATARLRREFLKRLAKHEVGEPILVEWLLKVRDPLHDGQVGAEKMLEAIKADSRQVQILAVAAGYNQKTWRQVDALALQKLLETARSKGEDLRTPIGFWRFSQKFLRSIRPRAGERLVGLYRQSMESLERSLYGKRAELYREFLQLQAEAEREFPELAPQPKVAKPQVKFTPVTAEQRSEMMGRAVIAGDAWRQDGQEWRLSVHNLTEAELVPAYELAESKVCVSELFNLPDGHLAVLAYVPDGQSVKVRSFYRSRSCGVWRYLPDYVRKPSGGIDFYGTGYAEESVTLPVAMQAALAELEKKHGVKKCDTTYNLEFFFAGTAAGYDSRQEYQTLLGYDRMRGDYYREVSKEPLNHDFEMTGMHKKAPYTLGIDHSRSPDFDQRVAVFDTVTLDAGRVKAEAFKSFDGQYCWVFFQDAKERVWIGQVEALSPLTSAGVDRDYVEMGDFMTPLYDYTNQAGVYGDQSDTRDARQCMWNNYLSNVPLIRAYLERGK